MAYVVSTIHRPTKRTQRKPRKFGLLPAIALSGLAWLTIIGLLRAMID